MDAKRIQACAARMERNAAALKWLEEHGTQLTGEDNMADVRVTLLLGSCLNGAKEAKEVLDSYAKLALPRLVQSAIASCRNTIEIDREAIRKEVEHQEPSDV